MELLPGLVQVKDEEPTQESMEVGGGAVSQTQRTHQTQAGVGGEDEEVWEAFDPSKLDLLGAGVEDGGEGGGSGGGGAGAGAVDYSQDYDGVGGGEDDDFRMDDDDGYQGYGDDDLGSLGGAAGMEEEPEAGRAGAGAAGRQEDGDGDGGSLDLEGAGGRRELSLLGGAGSNERVSVGDGDETLALDLGGGAGMEEEEGEGGLVGRASGRDGATPGPAGGVLGLSLLSSAGGGGGGESSGERGGRGGLGLRASPGSEEEGGLLSGRIRIGLGGHRRGSAAGSGAGSALSASIRARLSQEGRKRRLPVDQSLHLSGKQMRDRIADFTDLLEPRVRPRDRARWAAAAGAAGKRRGAGEGEEDEEGEEDDWGLDAEGAGERKGGGAAAAKQQRAASAAAAALALGPMDERMAVHTLSGALAPELEEVFGFMMRRGRAFGLPVARSTVAASSAAGVASPSPFKRQGQEDGSVASEAACGRKRGRDGEGVNGEGAAAAGATPAGGAAVEEDENEFGFGAGDDDFRMGRCVCVCFVCPGWCLSRDGPGDGLTHLLDQSTNPPATAATDDDGGGFFNGGGGSEDGYGYGGRILGDERDSEEEEEAARRRGGRDEGDSDEDEDEEEDGFIRTNAAGADDDLEAGAAPAAKWHPNTVRMCKLLRARMRKQGGGALGFGKDVAGGARRTKAANMFWEVRFVCPCVCVCVFVDSTDLTLTEPRFITAHTTGAAAQDVGLHRGAAGRGALCGD